MTSLTSSSHRSSSSSSYRSSARYSSSSSYRSDGSLGGSSDSLDPLFDSFLDSPDHSGLFGDDGPGAPSCLAPFGKHSRPSYGHSGNGTCTPMFCQCGKIGCSPSSCQQMSCLKVFAISQLNVLVRVKHVTIPQTLRVAKLLCI